MMNPLPEVHAVLTDSENAALQEAFYELFAFQAHLFTRHASGSLPKETADELMASILYTLGVHPMEPSSYRPLVGKDIFICFEKGQALLEQKKASALAQIQSLCLRTDDLGCIALRSTLSSLLDGVSHMDIRFFAHHIPGCIDYQLCLPVSESLMGLDYVLAYIQRLSLELQILARFPLHRVLALLDGVSRRWRELVCNLLTPVAENAMALILLDVPSYRLHLSESQRMLLLERFRPLTQGQLLRELNRAAQILAKELSIDGASLILQELANELAPRVFEAVQREDLSHVFFSFGLPTSCSKG